VSTPNPVLVAAAPALDAALAALETFVTNLGPDPTKLVVTFPGALSVLIGQIELQFPTLVNAEYSVVATEAQTKLAALRASLAAQTKTS